MTCIAALSSGEQFNRGCHLAELQQGEVHRVEVMIPGLAIALSFLVWPATDPESLEHEHHDLQSNHPHFAGSNHRERHAHAYVIDEIHSSWPRQR